MEKERESMPVIEKKLWEPDDPEAGTWSEMLSSEPLVIHAWPSTGFPLGSASVIGPLVKDRVAHFLIRPAGTIEPRGSHVYVTRVARSYLADHPRHYITFLGNNDRETQIIAEAGFHAMTLNQNCLINDASFHPLPDISPEYNAVYNARLSAEKRHELATEIERLALIYFRDSYAHTASEFHAEHARLRALMPHATFINRLTPDGCERLMSDRINRVLARSRVGLCLSEFEGAMLASIEYLLAGLSVVSTPCYGGRDYYFDDEFCLVAEPDPRSIRQAVDELMARNVPRECVRARTLARLETDRARYVALVQGIIDRAGGNVDFAPRFREMLQGRGIVNWRDMSEFSSTVLDAVHE